MTQAGSPIRLRAIRWQETSRRAYDRIAEALNRGVPHVQIPSRLAARGRDHALRLFRRRAAGSVRRRCGCDAALDARHGDLGLFRRRRAAGAAHPLGADGAHRHRLAQRHEHRRSGHLLRPRRHPARSGAPGRHRHPSQGAASQRRQRACADRADLCRKRRARRHAGGPHRRARAPGALRGEQQQPRHRRAARPAARALRQDHQIRSGAQCRLVLRRHRGAAASVHGHHGGGAAARSRPGQLAAALALGRQHGFQQARRRRDALSAGVQQRGAVLHRRLRTPCRATARSTAPPSRPR